MNTTFPGQSLSDVERFTTIKKRVRDIQNAKIGAEKEVEILRKHYDELVVQAKALGITDMEQLPRQIEELRQEISAELARQELQLTDLESKLKG